MKITVCDNCRKQLRDEEIVYVKAAVPQSNDIYPAMDKYFDLCMDCYKRLFENGGTNAD